jgi:hypothetical protein
LAEPPVVRDNPLAELARLLNRIDIDMGPLDAHTQADALKDALMARGLIAEVHKSRGHYLHPFLWVFSEKSECAEFVYTAPDNDGQLYFWYSITLERIVSAAEVSKAADMIAATLAPPKVRLIPVRAF